MDYETLINVLHYDPETGFFTWTDSPETASTHRNKPAGTSTNKGFILIRFQDEQYSAARLAVLYHTMLNPVYNVRHINQQPYDNRFSNLFYGKPKQIKRKK